VWKHTIKQENNIYITLKSKIKGTLRPKPELAQGQKGQKLFVSERLHHRECPQNGPLPLGPHLIYDSFDPPECMPQTTSIISLTIFVGVTSCVQQRDIPTTPHLQQKATPLHSTLLLLLLLHTFNGPLSGTTQVSRYQKGKTNLGFTEVRGSGISWAICKSAPRSRQPRQHPATQVFTGRMPFLMPNQQRQSTEGILVLDNK